MIDVKPYIEQLLKSIDGVKVAFYYPSSFNNLPAVSYYELADSEAMRADNREYAQDIDIQIDVWGTSAKQVNDIGISVNAVMQSDGWKRAFAADVPKDGSVYHRTMRFNKVIYI